MDRTRAEALRQAAKQSVTAIDPSAEARLVAEETAAVVWEYAVQILQTEDYLLRMEKQLIARMRDHPAFPVLVSIPGIGELSAAKIITLIGDVARFPNASALVAFAGLDPRVRQSGDMRAPRRISKRGNPLLRATLFLNASVAVRYPGPLHDFYHRLREAGKVHRVAIVACMNKLLRIVYACWLKQEMFDPYRLTHVSKATSENRHNAIIVRHKPEEIPAPISRREAIRRYQQKERKEVSLPKRE
jgi:transposase